MQGCESGGKFALFIYLCCRPDVPSLAARRSPLAGPPPLTTSPLWLLVVQETLEGLQSAEPMAEKLKGQLNDLVRYSRDLGSQSERVTALIKQHNR